MSEGPILQPNGETATALLADPEAKIRGKQVSATQLARWHREGYVPPPVRHGLGRGRGTVSIYPPGTREQLRGLCAFLSKERDAEKVQWRMWWAGYAVPDAFADHWLMQAARAWEDLDESLRSMQTEEERESGVLPEKAWDVIDEVRDVRLRPSVMRSMRGRGGRDSFVAVFRMILEAAAGVFQGYRIDSLTRTATEDRQDVLKVLGLDQLTLPPSMAPGPDFAGGIEDGLRYLSRLIAQTRPRDLLDTASRDELDRARNELREVSDAFRAVPQFMTEVMGDRAGGNSRDVERMVNEMHPIHQALFMLLWLAMRRDGQGDRLDAWLQLSRMTDVVLAMLRARLATNRGNSEEASL